MASRKVNKRPDDDSSEDDDDTKVDDENKSGEDTGEDTDNDDSGDDDEDDDDDSDNKNDDDDENDDDDDDEDDDSKSQTAETFELNRNLAAFPSDSIKTSSSQSSSSEGFEMIGQSDSMMAGINPGPRDASAESGRLTAAEKESTPSKKKPIPAPKPSRSSSAKEQSQNEQNSGISFEDAPKQEGSKAESKEKRKVSSETGSKRAKNKNKGKATVEDDTQKCTVFITQVAEEHINDLKYFIKMKKYASSKITEENYIKLFKILSLTFEDEADARNLCEIKFVEFPGFKFEIFCDFDSATQVPESERTLYVLNCDQEWEEIARDRLKGDKQSCAYDPTTRSVVVVYKKKADFNEGLKLGSLTMFGTAKLFSDKHPGLKQCPNDEKSDPKNQKNKTQGKRGESAKVRQQRKKNENPEQENFGRSASPEEKEEETSRRSRAVMLQNIPEEISDDSISLILESKKYTGCSNVAVQNVIPVKSIMPGAVVAVIETSKGVQDLVNAKIIKYKKNEYKIQTLPKNIEQMVFNSICVTDLPQGIKKEVLSLLMENAGSGDVKSCRIRKDRAVVTFEEDNVADDLLKKGQVKHKGKNLVLRPFKGDSDWIENDSTKVLVRGIPQEFDINYLQMLFENKRLSGGGEIKNLTRISSTDKALITYCTEQDADDVISKKTIHYDGKVFIAERPSDSTDNVNELSESDITERSYPNSSKKDSTIDEKRFLIKGVPESVTDLALSSCLSSLTKAIIASIDRCMLSSQRLVTFQTPLDYNSIEKLVGGQQCFGSNISISALQKPQEFIVTGENFSDSMKDTLTMYLENNTSCDVANVKIRNRSCATVEFKSAIGSCNPFNRNSCEAIKAFDYNSIAGDHQVTTNMRVKIRPYYSCLEYSELNAKMPEIPDSITLDLESELHKFLANYDDVRNTIEKRLSETGFTMTLKSGDNKVELRPAGASTDDWTEQGKKELKHVLSEIITKDVAITISEYSTETLNAEVAKSVKGLGKIKYQFIHKNEGRFLSLTGLRENAKEFEGSFQNILTRLAKEREEGLLIEEKVAITQGQCDLLRISGFISEVEEAYKEFTIIPNSDKSEYKVKAKKSEINFIRSSILEKATSIECQKLQLSPDILSCFQLEKIQEMIMKELKSKSLYASFSISDSACLIYTMDKKAADAAVRAIKDKVDVATYENIPSSHKLQQLTTKLNKEYSQYLKIRVENCRRKQEMKDIGKEECCTVTISGSKEHIDLASAEIEEYIGNNQLVEKRMDMDPPYCQLLMNHKSSKLREISQNLRGFKYPTDEQQAFILSGSQINVDKAFNEICELTVEVVSADRKVENGEYFLTTQGRDRLDGIGKRNKVYIEVESGNDSLGASGGSSTTLTGAVISKYGQRISACCGDIKVYPTDAIVIWDANNKDQPLGLTAEVLSVGDSFIINAAAGNLACKNIIVGIVKIYKNGKSQEWESLFETVRKCLASASTQRLTKVAFSYLEEKHFKYPIEVAVDVFMQATKDYFDSTQNSSIRNVVIVDKEQSVITYVEDKINALEGVEDHSDDANYRQLRGLANVALQPAAAAAAGRSTAAGGPTAAAAATVAPYKKSGQNVIETNEGVKVTIRTGSIASDTADALVNTCNPSLDLTHGAVSASILKAAGQKIQDECTKIKPANFGYGDFVKTLGYNLKCRSVYHGSVPAWDKGSGGTEKAVRQLLDKILVDADKSGFISIVFPAIGTGNLAHPPDKVASIMFDEIAKFSSAHPQTKLKDVQFSIFVGNNDTTCIDAFKKQMDVVVTGTPADATGGAARIFDNRQQTGPSVNAKYDPNSGIASIGSLKVQLKQGDISKESGSVIVCPSNSYLDLSIGEVPKAIARAAGDNFVKEVKAGRIGPNRIFMCKGGNLAAKNVFVTDFYSSNDTWVSKVKTCLVEADSKGHDDIIFPLLGAGKLNVNPSDMADYMIEAVVQFLSKGNPKYLRKIVICIFNGKDLKPFSDSVAKKCAKLSQGVPQDSQQVVTRKKSRSVVLQVYGFDQDSVQKAIREADDANGETRSAYVFESEDDVDLIKHLNPVEISHIQNVNEAEGLDVEIQVVKEPPVHKITVCGSGGDVTLAVNHINRIFQLIRSKTLKREMSSKLKNTVQWMYEDGGQWKPYNDDINIDIEIEFSTGRDHFEFTERNNKFRIDFKTYTEQVLNTTYSHRVKRVTPESGYPGNWDEMKDSDNLGVIKLDPNSAEYKGVQTNALATHGNTIKQIVQISRIQNKELYKQYEARKHVMESMRRKNQIERRLWHGTALETTQRINIDGFNRSYCGKNATLIGMGSYFAVNFNYSAQATYSPVDQNGHKHIYQCKVLTGDYAKGDPNYKVPPPLPSPAIGNYDSVVNDVNNPIMFVVFYDAQAYPEYLITFV